MTKKDYNPSKAHQDAMQQNPIETAIGDRAKPKSNLADLPENAVLTPLPQNPSEIQDEPSHSEMVTLEELNRQTEERLQDQYPEQEQPEVKRELRPLENYPKAPVSKTDPQPATKTSSPESPPQKSNEKPWEKVGEDTKFAGEKIDNSALPKGSKVTLCDCPQNHDESILHIETPAEDIELTALKKYIFEDGFVLATVAFHIVSLCAQPMTTPSTTMWDFKDRAQIPDMVLALLNQPGYLEGIWPSLRIVMGSNAGNAAWTAGISTTIAFFDVIRTLPTIRDLKDASS